MVTKITPNRSTGKVRVYDIPSKRWVSVFPIDAKEGRGVGTVSLLGPIHKASKQGQADVMICPEEVDRYTASGFKVSKPSAEVEAEIAKNDDVVDFTKFKVEELRKFAFDAGIEEFSSMKKDELCAALDEKKYQPK